MDIIHEQHEFIANGIDYRFAGAKVRILIECKCGAYGYIYIPVSRNDKRQLFVPRWRIRLKLDDVRST